MISSNTVQMGSIPSNQMTAMWRDPGRIKMPCGKYEGQEMWSVPLDYLEWMVRDGVFWPVADQGYDWVRRFVERYLNMVRIELFEKAKEQRDECLSALKAMQDEFNVAQSVIVTNEDGEVYELLGCGCVSAMEYALELCDQNDQ